MVKRPAEPLATLVITFNKLCLTPYLIEDFKYPLVNGAKIRC